jgi:type IV pilus assembly protein PilC
VATFAWEGNRAEGGKVKGEAEAPNIGVLKYRLRHEGIIVLTARRKKKPIRQFIPFLREKIKDKTLLEFFRQLATLIAAGVPIIRSFEVLIDQQKNRIFRKIVSGVKGEVEGGAALADGFSKYPRVFDELSTNLIAAGELGGVLDQVLDRLALYKEKIVALKRKIKGAMVYPILTIIVAIAVITIIMIWVIPVFEEVFAEFGATLPAPTQFVINCSRWVRQYWLYMLGGVVFVIFSIKLIRKTKKGRYIFDWLFLKIPLIGKLLLKGALARFTRTLSLMLQSGVPIIQGLDIVSNATGNKVVEKHIGTVKEQIVRGEPFYKPMSEIPKIFTPLVVQMTMVGEESGELEGMLSKVADFYDQEVDAAVETLTTLLEPIMIIFLGGIVGFIVVALYLPIFQLGAVVGGASAIGGM